MSAKLSPELLARPDSTAAAWGLNRAAALRRLVELADVDGLMPTAVPTMDELIAIPSEKARYGNMAAVSFWRHGSRMSARWSLSGYSNGWGRDPSERDRARCVEGAWPEAVAS